MTETATVAMVEEAERLAYDLAGAEHSDEPIPGGLLIAASGCITRLTRELSEARAERMTDQGVEMVAVLAVDGIVAELRDSLTAQGWTLTEKRDGSWEGIIRNSIREQRGRG